MDELAAYLPVLLLVLVVVAALFATAADRSRQLAAIAGGFSRMRGAATRFGVHGGGLRRRLSGKRRRRHVLRRSVFWLIALYLLSYLWAYQRAQDAIAVQLAEHGIEEVKIGSLIIPWSAFFQSAYTANAGFSKSKKRTRIEVFIDGYFWADMDARIDETGLAKINKISGQKFVFSYLTDVKVLRPAINRHMKQLVRGKQIDAYQIETFDNRGPYIIVVLSPQNRGKDVNTAAASLAESLHTNLTRTNQLKVNQVVVKVVDPEPYLTTKTIHVIARGTAGNY